MYLDRRTVADAVASLRGSADHLFKVWLTLKQMGLALREPAIRIDTSNSSESLERLFGGVLESGKLFVPFAKTPRFRTMQPDASRSIIQSTIRRWATSGSVVTVDPSSYIDFRSLPGGDIQVSTGHRYPMGLGHGKNGFAPEDNASLAMPIGAWAVWYNRVTAIPEDVDAYTWLVDETLSQLGIDHTERELVFAEDDIEALSFDIVPLSLESLNSICLSELNASTRSIIHIREESQREYTRRVQTVADNLDRPLWLRREPETEVRRLISGGECAILLYGPPRTGKTHIIDNIIPRSDSRRITIQIHDGWSYEHLIQGMKPDQAGNWSWTDGPLIAAIKEEKNFIVLEEANRTSLTQSLGEVFYLVEAAYRGSDHTVTLRSGDRFWIPEDVTLVFTLNTVDRSTDDIDDAFLGRVAAVECPPSSEALSDILTSKDIVPSLKSSILTLFHEIGTVYPLGHGYFADLQESNVGPKAVLNHYMSRIRPVLHISLGEAHSAELTNIDSLVNELFAQ